jgi:hypothetical protein
MGRGATAFGQTKVNKRARSRDANVEIGPRAGLLPPWGTAIDGLSLGQTNVNEM